MALSLPSGVASRFAVEGLLGSGGQGRVMLVRDAARNNQRVALKQTEPALLQDLMREFGLLSRLNHPHLVPVYDFFQTSPLGDAGEGGAAYTQEHVEGLDLLSVCRQCSPSEKEALFEQIFQALAYLHALDVIHCDLKPENVLVERADQLRARLLDFGIARHGTTGPSGVRGSRSYIAPEVLLGAPATPEADLYALGVMMAEAWIGRTPTPEDLASKLRDAEARRSYFISAGLPESWSDVVVALLAQDPKSRPSSIAEAADLWGDGLERPVTLQTAATTTSMLRAGPLVGRDAEEESTYEQLQEGRSVAFTGPRGVGKSTLCREVMRRLQRDGVDVEWWSGLNHGGDLQSLAEALGRLLHADIVWRTNETLTDDTEVAGVVSRAEALSVRYAAWLEGECERLIGELPSRCDGRPVLFLDDLALGSPLLRHLAQRLFERCDDPSYPLQLVIVSGDSVETATTLRPLSRIAAQELVGTRLGESATSERLGGVLAAASGGIPLAMENLLALLVEREELVYRGGKWTLVVDPAEIRLPDTSIEAVSERISLLSPSAREHLGAVAWIKFPTRPAEIASVLGRACDRMTLLEMDAAGLLWRDMDGTISIGHSAIYDAFDAWKPPIDESIARHDLLSHVSLTPLARAWHLGGKEGCHHALAESESAWSLGNLRLAEQAIRVALHGDLSSIAALRHAARIANLVGPREWQVQCLEQLLEQDVLERDDRLSIEADLFWALTRIGDAKRAEEIGRDLLDHARQAGQQTVYVDALIHMANTQIQRGDYKKGRESLLEALPHADGTPFMARILNNLGNVERYEGRLQEALSRYRQAYEMKLEEGDPIGTRIALGNMGLICLELGRYPEALEHFTKSRQAAVETGHLRGEAFSLLGLAHIGLKAGAFTYARRRANQAAEIADQLGDRVVAWDALGTLVEVALASGDTEEARRLSGLSLQRYADVDSPYNLAGAKSVRAMAVQDTEPLVAQELANDVISDSSVTDATIRSHAGKVLCELALGRGELDHAASALESVLSEDAWKAPIQVLAALESAARLVGTLALTERVHVACNKALEAGLNWPDIPWDDGVDAQAVHDGPSLASYDRQSAVAKLRRSLVNRETVAMSMTKNEDSDSGWLAALANASAGEMDSILFRYVAGAVQSQGAERGFLINSEGKLMVSADADGEPVASAQEKVPDGVLTLVSESGCAYRADSASGQKGALCAIPAFADGALAGVLILQNRFASDAFPDVHTGDGPDDVLGLSLRLRALLKELDATHEERADREREVRKEQTRSTEEILRLRKELESTRELLSPENNYSEIVFRSSAMKKMLRRLDRVVGSSLPVYVHGESGSGKELVARAIHAHGERQDGPFLAQNCSAIPTTLFESEFFGHEKGAFTGADRASEGLFRRASGGTLFLDEIGDLPLDLQAKLLRVLESGEVRAVGGRTTHRVDVRIICATHRDLAKQVEDKRFREDLFYRLNVVRVDVPPLRERPDDIPLLVAHFMEAHRPPGSEVPEFNPGVMKALINYRWPGNVRQLENEVIRASLLSDGAIGLKDLSPEILQPASLSYDTASDMTSDSMSLGSGTLKERVDRLEFQVLKGCLEKYRGNKSKVARELGLSRAGLNMKLKRLELWEQDSE